METQANVDVRLAQACDLPGILALYRELRTYDPPLAPQAAEQGLARILGDSHLHLIVCEVVSEQGTLAATCMLAINHSLAQGARPFGIIENVVTLAAYRGQGLGRKVMQFALKRAWEQGCYKVVLLSGVALAPAHKLYESVGFRGDIERGFVVKPD